MATAHFIGLSDFHVAPLINDDETGFAYGDMVSIPEIISCEIKPTTDEAYLYADDKSVDVATDTKQFELTVEMAGLTLEHKALLLGHSFDSDTGVLKASSTDIAPFLGIAFKTLASNGKYRYVKFNKAKFVENDESAKTKGENIEFNTPTITAKCVYRSNDNIVYTQADENEGATVAATWFTAF